MSQSCNKVDEKHNQTSRSELRQLRCAIPAQKRIGYDESIRQHLMALIHDREIRSIAGYWPFNGEPDLIPLFRQLMDTGCKLALPVISPRQKGLMKFCTWQQDTPLARNKFGIFEPQVQHTMMLGDIQLIIIPLVAYDRFGNRLGMGAGYYDRHLEPLRNCRSPIRAGVAYSLQELDATKKDEWDIPLHGIVNERGWFTFVD